MLQTYGKPNSTFSRSQEAIALDAVARNLSGKPNPGSKHLLSDMNSRKKEVKKYIIIYSESECAEW
jgi:hypothetical protein